MEAVKRKIKGRFSELCEDPCQLFSLFGFVFVGLAGTLLHFLPDVAAGNLVYLIAPTNESIWEHLKLLFYPYLIFMAAEYFAYGKETRGFFGAKLRGVLLGEAGIVGIYYIYSGILGKNLAWVDISLFFVGCAIAYIIPYLLIKRGKSKDFSARSAALIFILQILLFSIFTFMPPEIGIFIDPVSGMAGIN